MRGHIGMREGGNGGRACRGPGDTAAAGRIHLRHVGGVCRGGVHLGAVYLYDVIGVQHRRNLDLLHEVGSRLASLRGPWILAGDPNCTPEQLAATGWLRLVDGCICAPKGPTCNGKVYDYFVISTCLRQAVHSVVTVVDGGFTPHSPVRLHPRAAARHDKVRGIAGPKGFRAHLPFGPENQQVGLEELVA